MATNFNQISVGTGETQIATLNANRVSITIQVEGADIYIGNSGLTVSNGFKIVNGETFVLEAPTFTGDIYAISSGTATVYVSEGA